MARGVTSFCIRIGIAAEGLLWAGFSVAQEIADEVVAETAGVATGIAPGSELESLSGPLLRMVLSLAAVLALVAGCAWLARRLRGAQLQGGLIQIVSGLSLGPKEKVVLLRVGDEEILVGMSQAGIQSLHVMGKPVSTQKFSLGMGALKSPSQGSASQANEQMQ